MAPFNGIPTKRQQVALALAPKFTAALSMLGSSYIVYDCFRKHQHKNDERASFYRIMVGLSVCDLLMSMGLFTSTWPMPADTPNVWGAVGTTQSCEAIGFLEQVGVAATMYNGSLSLYYLLRIRYGWKPTELRKAEVWLHVVPISFGLATMITSLVLNLFNSGIFDCWIAPFPQGCKESWRNNGVTTCERGDNASLYQWLFDLIPKWSSILLVTINMLVIYQAVLKQEQRTLRFSSSRFSVNVRNEPPKPKIARRLARQSYLYVGALYITYVPVITTRATELIAGHVYYGMLLTISITIPLQGFWNVMVYLRPRYIRQRDRMKRLRRQQEGDQVISSVSFLKAVSQAVREGDLSEEDDDDDEEDEEETDTTNGENDGKAAASLSQSHPNIEEMSLDSDKGPGKAP